MTITASKSVEPDEYAIIVTGTGSPSNSVIYRLTVVGRMVGGYVQQANTLEPLMQWLTLCTAIALALIKHRRLPKAFFFLDAFRMM